MIWWTKDGVSRLTVTFTLVACAPMIVATAMAYGLIGIDTELGRRVASHFGALMLVFLGGMHWGFGLLGYGALTDDEKESYMGTCFGAAAVILASLALFLPTTLGLIVLVISFLAYLIYDFYAAKMGMSPRWKANIRNGFVVVMVSCLFACALVPAGRTPITPHSFEEHPLFGNRDK